MTQEADGGSDGNVPIDLYGMWICNIFLRDMLNQLSATCPSKCGDTGRLHMSLCGAVTLFSDSTHSGFQASDESRASIFGAASFKADAAIDCGRSRGKTGFARVISETVEKARKTSGCNSCTQQASPPRELRSKWNSYN